MYYGLKAAKKLNKRSASLRSEHTQLRRLLEARGTPAEQLADSIKNLRLHLRESHIDSIEVTQTLTRRCTELNLSACAEAMIAMQRLVKICSGVTSTLNELDSSERHSRK